MKRYLAVKGQSYMVNKVKTQSGRDLIRLEVLTVLMRRDVSITLYINKPQFICNKQL